MHKEHWQIITLPKIIFICALLILIVFIHFFSTKGLILIPVFIWFGFIYLIASASQLRSESEVNDLPEKKYKKQKNNALYNAVYFPKNPSSRKYPSQNLCCYFSNTKVLNTYDRVPFTIALCHDCLANIFESDSEIHFANIIKEYTQNPISVEIFHLAITNTWEKGQVQESLIQKGYSQDEINKAFRDLEEKRIMLFKA